MSALDLPPISVHAWRRRPALRLTVPRERQIQWFWAYCSHWGRGCDHKVAVPTAPLVIRWGPDGWAEMARRTLRCSACGRRGVEIKHPSWGGTDMGWMPMPIERMAPVPSLD